MVSVIEERPLFNDGVELRSNLVYNGQPLGMPAKYEGKLPRRPASLCSLQAFRPIPYLLLQLLLVLEDRRELVGTDETL